MNHIQNHMRAQALLAGNGRTFIRLGTVDAYDPSNYAVKVAIQPENVPYGWMPVLSPWVGNGWGLFTPPTPGDQIMVFFQEGEREVPVAGMCLFNDVDRPLNVPSGEAWMVHKSGSLLKFHNDGTVEMQATTFNMTGDIVLKGNITQTGNLTQTGSTTTSGTVQATGNISSNADILDGHGSVSALRTAYDQHVHTDPQGGSTGTPSVTA